MKPDELYRLERETDDLLERVRARLADPARWHGDAGTREGDLGCGGALDVAGRQVAADDPAAVRHCVIGALKHEAGVPEGIWPLPGPAGDAFERIAAAAGWEPGTCLNDYAGYRAVYAAVEAAAR